MQQWAIPAEIAAAATCSPWGSPSHVLYDVQGIAPFIAPLTNHARRPVVIEQRTRGRRAVKGRNCRPSAHVDLTRSSGVSALVG